MGHLGLFSQPKENLPPEEDEMHCKKDLGTNTCKHNAQRPRLYSRSFKKEYVSKILPPKLHRHVACCNKTLCLSIDTAASNLSWKFISDGLSKECLLISDKIKQGGSALLSAEGC